MTSNEERWVTIREYAHLSDRVTNIEARLLPLVDKFDKLNDKIDALSALVSRVGGNPGDPLAQHHMAAALTKVADAALSGPKSGGLSAVDRILQIGGALAIGALSFKFFGGVV